MELFYVPLCAIASIIFLFLITRATGNRQISSLSLYDYINGITLGSIAAEMAFSANRDFWACGIAMAIYGLATWGSAVLSNRSRALRHVIAGKPILLMEKGKLFRANFRRAHLDLEEFLASLRSMGYFDLSKVDSAILEINGQISVLPKTAQRPLTPEDLSLSPPEDALTHSFIEDGILIESSLQQFGRDRAWVDAQLQQAGISHIEEVFFASFHPDGTATFFLHADPPQKEIF